MRNILDERREFYKNQMRERFANDLKNLDNIELNHIEEVINAIALGCCLQKPRTFGNEIMTSEDFREIARVAPFEMFCIPVQAMAREQKKGRTIKNRIWYIMGIFATIGPQPQTRPRKSDHKERVYTQEELDSVLNRSLSDFDL